MPKKKPGKLLRSLPETTFFPVELFSKSLWDEDFGTMITVKGVVELLDELKLAQADGWKFDSLEISEADDTLFLLKMTRPEEVKLPKNFGKVT